MCVIYIHYLFKECVIKQVLQSIIACVLLVFSARHVFVKNN